MQRKKKSFKDTFAELQNLGMKELADFFVARGFKHRSDIKHIVDSIEKYQNFLNDANSFMTVGNLTATFLQNFAYVSENCKNIIGYEPHDFLKGGVNFFYDIFCQADKGASTDFLLKIIDHHKKAKLHEKTWYTYTTTFRLFHKLGYLKWMKNNWIFYAHDSKGRPTISISVISDIDDIKKDDMLSFEICKHNPENGESTIELQYQEPPEGYNLLTDTDTKILNLLAQGRTNKEIGDLLGCSEHKVKDYRKKMLKKTWCSNITELIYFAYRNKLIIK